MHELWSSGICAQVIPVWRSTVLFGNSKRSSIFHSAITQYPLLWFNLLDFLWKYSTTESSTLHKIKHQHHVPFTNIRSEDVKISSLENTSAHQLNKKVRNQLKIRACKDELTNLPLYLYITCLFIARLVLTNPMYKLRVWWPLPCIKLTSSSESKLVYINIVVSGARCDMDKAYKFLTYAEYKSQC